MAINPIDILLVVVILLSVLNGYRRGFVHGVIDLAGWVLSLIAGLRAIPCGSVRSPIGGSMVES